MEYSYHLVTYKHGMWKQLLKRWYIKKKDYYPKPALRPRGVYDTWPIGIITLKAFLKHLGKKSNTHTYKTTLQRTVPVCRMEKIISDMSKYKQLIKQLILFVPREGNIPQAYIYRKEQLFAFSRDMLVLAKFLDFPFFKTTSLKTSPAKKNVVEKSYSRPPFHGHPGTHRDREVRQRKYSLDWFLRICPWKQKQTLINQRRMRPTTNFQPLPAKSLLNLLEK